MTMHEQEEARGLEADVARVREIADVWATRPARYRSDSQALSRVLDRIAQLEEALGNIANELPMGAYGTPLHRAQETARAALERNHP